MCKRYCARKTRSEKEEVKEKKKTEICKSGFQSHKCPYSMQSGASDYQSIVWSFIHFISSGYPMCRDFYCKRFYFEIFRSLRYLGAIWIYFRYDFGFAFYSRAPCYIALNFLCISILASSYISVRFSRRCEFVQFGFLFETLFLFFLRSVFNPA